MDTMLYTIPTVVNEFEIPEKMSSSDSSCMNWTLRVLVTLLSIGACFLSWVMFANINVDDINTVITCSKNITLPALPAAFATSQNYTGTVAQTTYTALHTREQFFLATSVISALDFIEKAIALPFAVLSSIAVLGCIVLIVAEWRNADGRIVIACSTILTITSGVLLIFAAMAVSVNHEESETAENGWTFPPIAILNSFTCWTKTNETIQTASQLGIGGAVLGVTTPLFLLSGVIWSFLIAGTRSSHSAPISIPMQATRQRRSMSPNAAYRSQMTPEMTGHRFIGVAKSEGRYVQMKVQQQQRSRYGR